jgi:hypothetical protein
MSLPIICLNLKLENITFLAGFHHGSMLLEVEDTQPSHIRGSTIEDAHVGGSSLIGRRHIRLQKVLQPSLFHFLFTPGFLPAWASPKKSNSNTCRG